jgi:hypothetical protein
MKVIKEGLMWCAGGLFAAFMVVLGFIQMAIGFISTGLFLWFVWYLLARIF